MHRYRKRLNDDQNGNERVRDECVGHAANRRVGSQPTRSGTAAEDNNIRFDLSGKC
jgi:hypothetical protein